MFGRKKQPLVTQVDDSRSIVRDFRRRPPFESYRAMEYTISPKLQEKHMYPLLDQSLGQLLPCADDGNQNMLNNQLLSRGVQGIEDLNRQRINHRDTIHRLAARRQTDRADLVRMLDAELQNLRELLEEYEKTCSLLAAFEKGEN